jgi:hypothetical protein
MNEMPMQPPMQQMPPMQPGQMMPMQMQPPRQGVFGKKPGFPENNPQQDYTEELMRRLRTLEERYSGLDRRMGVFEQNLLATDRRLSSELKTLGAELLEIKNSVEDVKDKIRMMVDELKQSAKIEDVEIIKKYTDFLDPLKFVTQEQLEKIVREIVEDKVAELQQHVAQSLVQKIVKQVSDEKEASETR